MYRPIFTKQFKKDIKLAAKQGRDIDLFKLIARLLISGKKLDPIFKDHHLVGDYIGRRECRVESDWLLIYKIENDMIIFERAGSHSELFSK